MNPTYPLTATHVYQAPRESITEYTFDSLIERISKLVRSIICFISSLFGIIIHGNYDNTQLKVFLEQFDIHELLKTKQIKHSKILSEEAQQLILDSFEGLPQVLDTHLHILGYDEDNYLNPKLDRGLSGIKFSVIHCAASGSAEKDHSTRRAAERLRLYAQHFPGYQGMILPIHPTVKKDGTVDWENTGSYLNNQTAWQASEKLNQSLFPAISIHPDEKNWSQMLLEARKKGILLVKWFPTQAINPSSKEFIPFYQTLRDLGMTLIAHSGPQHTVPSPKEWKDYTHPSKFELPLRNGVDVILAHSGHKENLDDFIALSKKAHEENWPGKLYGDVGGMLHYGPDFAKKLIEHSHCEGVRILYGTDHPYENLVTPFKDPYKLLAEANLLDKKNVKALQAIRNWNPLVANFVAIRQLRIKTQGGDLKFPNRMFLGMNRNSSPNLFVKLFDRNILRLQPK